MADVPPPSRKPRDDEIDTYGMTHAGKVRKVNQDHFLLASVYKRLHVIASSLPETEALHTEDRVAYLAMVADGVGSGVGGGEASATALQSSLQYVNDSMACFLGREEEDDSETAEALQRAALRSHEAILARRAATGAEGTMATTLTMFLGVWPRYYLMQVGDSRYYQMRDGVLTQITRDQTFAESLIEAGALTREAAKSSRLAHVLSSALGADETLPVVTPLPADWRNIHLLCSDGLTKHVSDERIGEILRTMSSAKEACEQLVQEALDGGGTDNITVIVGRTIPR